MRKALALSAFLSLLCLAATAQEARRELGAHEHGRGTVNIAIEEKRVTIELEVPGMDIVGFEHPAGTLGEKASTRDARSTLSRPLALFRLPAAAGCRVKEAKVALKAEEDDHDHAGHEHGSDAKDHPHGDKDGDAGARHTEFRGEYELECAVPSALAQIEFDYFKHFKGAERLVVTIITAKGQNQFEVSRERPRLDLAGLV